MFIVNVNAWERDEAGKLFKKLQEIYGCDIYYNDDKKIRGQFSPGWNEILSFTIMYLLFDKKESKLFGFLVFGLTK